MVPLASRAVFEGPSTGNINIEINVTCEWIFNHHLEMMFGKSLHNTHGLFQQKDIKTLNSCNVKVLMHKI